MPFAALWNARTDSIDINLGTIAVPLGEARAPAERRKTAPTIFQRPSLLWIGLAQATLASAERRPAAPKKRTPMNNKMPEGRAAALRPDHTAEADLSRRRFIRGAMLYAVAVGSGAALSACGGGDGDGGDPPPPEMQARPSSTVLPVAIRSQTV